MAPKKAPNGDFNAQRVSLGHFSLIKVIFEINANDTEVVGVKWRRWRGPEFRSSNFREIGTPNRGR
jgi:hypothetical protein